MLSRRPLAEIEVKIWQKKVLTMLLSKANEPELKQDFEEFCSKMRVKWHFRNEPTPEFSTTPAFNPKSTWKPPNGSPSWNFFKSGWKKVYLKLVSQL